MPKKKKAPKKVFVVFDETTGDVVAVYSTKKDAKNDKTDEDVVVTYVKEEGGK